LKRFASLVFSLKSGLEAFDQLGYIKIQSAIEKYRPVSENHFPGRFSDRAIGGHNEFFKLG
jgi:hypothetical protein